MIITGSKRSGKTTLLSRLFTEKLPGLTSWCERQKSVYLKDNLSDFFVQVGSFSSEEQKMVLCSDGFEASGIHAVLRLIDNSSPWITIDEIGYLEENCFEYQKALRKLFDKKQVAVVLRKQNLPFINELYSRDDVFIIDLDNPFGNIGCVIMASGFGKRFGGNKLLEDFRGKPLFSYVLDATDDIFSKRVVVTRYKEIEEFCKAREIDVVMHDLPYRNDTVRLGLDALQGVEHCMFVTSDQPLLSSETVRGIALAGVNARDKIWRVTFGESLGLPAIFPKWTFDELFTLGQGEGGGVVIKRHPEAVSEYGVKNELELRDVDTYEELKALENNVL